MTPMKRLARLARAARAAQMVWLSSAWQLERALVAPRAAAWLVVRRQAPRHPNPEHRPHRVDAFPLPRPLALQECCCPPLR